MSEYTRINIGMQEKNIKNPEKILPRVSQKKAASGVTGYRLSSGAYEIRTHDLYNANVARSQLR